MNSGEGTNSSSTVSSKNRILHYVKNTTDERQSTYDLATLMGTLNIEDMPDQAVRISLF
jgi:hypothetical protein